MDVAIKSYNVPTSFTRCEDRQHNNTWDQKKWIIIACTYLEKFIIRTINPSLLKRVVYHVMYKIRT